MRKEFVELLHVEMGNNPNIFLLTADLGYGLFDAIRKDYPDKFFNVGSAEQLMIGMAAGLAMEGKIPICYSITSFLLYRPFEFIRHFMNNDKLLIKLVGGGRDKDYGYLGSTHWMEDDMSIISQLPNITLYKPKSKLVDDKLYKNYLVNELPLDIIFDEFINSKNPSYINLKK